MKAASVKPVRCAIYTRVSTEQGLDQEFNSLDAQYDAASAYIRSQAHAGWTLIRSRYDDGGYSCTRRCYSARWSVACYFGQECSRAPDSAQGRRTMMVTLGMWIAGAGLVAVSLECSGAA
ncbi:MAG: site-specific recombinase, partial [Rhodospirillaceae bacterium]|nr:site-specific recombinase [Rhodospirillaceae bacterium]